MREGGMNGIGAAEMDEAIRLKHRVEQFLFLEARLLDANAWDEWLRLFTPTGMYWVPRERGQQDARTQVSLFHEDALLRNVRARRLANHRNWSQQPPTHGTRTIGNVSVTDPGPGTIVVRSSFQMLEWRADNPRAFGGSYTHTLREDPAAAGSFRIELKRVDLVNCDAIHENLQVFL